MPARQGSPRASTPKRARRAQLESTVTPVKADRVAEAPEADQKPAPLPALGSWVTVQVQKKRRSKKEQLLSKTPGVVSALDAAAAKVTVLFPNAAPGESAQSGPLLFATEVHPAADIQAYTGDVAALQGPLMAALLAFVDRKGRASAEGGGSALSVSATKSRGGGLARDAERLQASIRTFLDVAAEEDESHETPGGLEEFRPALKRLLEDRQRVLTRVTVLQELGEAFPDWAEHLLALKREGEIVLADDLVLPA